MIRTLRHLALKRLYQEGDPSGVRADQIVRIEDVPAHLDVAIHAGDMGLPGYELHPLKGKLKGF